jgi:hypothetical protein
VFAVMAPVLWLPLVGNAPLQPPEAMHAVALVELHVSIDSLPLGIMDCDALIDAVGGGSFGDMPTPLPQDADSSAATIAMTGDK